MTLKMRKSDSINACARLFTGVRVRNRKLSAKPHVVRSNKGGFRGESRAFSPLKAFQGEALVCQKRKGAPGGWNLKVGDALHHMSPRRGSAAPCTCYQ